MNSSKQASTQHEYHLIHVYTKFCRVKVINCPKQMYTLLSEMKHHVYYCMEKAHYWLQNRNQVKSRYLDEADFLLPGRNSYTG
jgi:hypothetical protein